MLAVKVLAFDTGGTILDWHSGFVAAFKDCGARRGAERSWDEFVNEYRRRTLRSSSRRLSSTIACWDRLPRYRAKFTQHGVVA
jgi:FMN phosphatase YigB (HAD superfamily)